MTLANPDFLKLSREEREEQYDIMRDGLEGRDRENIDEWIDQVESEANDD